MKKYRLRSILRKISDEDGLFDNDKMEKLNEYEMDLFLNEVKKRGVPIHLDFTHPSLNSRIIDGLTKRSVGHLVCSSLGDPEFCTYLKSIYDVELGGAMVPPSDQVPEKFRAPLLYWIRWTSNWNRMNSIYENSKA